MNDITLPIYYDMLSRHDWYYDYSDDHSVWQRGRDASENLRRIADTNGKEFKDLRDGFRAHYFSGEAFGKEKQPIPEKPKDYVFHKLQR